MSEFKVAEQLFVEGRNEESLTCIESLIANNSETVETLMLRAKIYFKLQKWGDCLNDLNKVLDSDAGHTMAKNYKLMVMDILMFWNKDSYNP